MISKSYSTSCLTVRGPEHVLCATWAVGFAILGYFGIENWIVFVDQLQIRPVQISIYNCGVQMNCKSATVKASMIRLSYGESPRFTHISQPKISRIQIRPTKSFDKERTNNMLVNSRNHSMNKSHRCANPTTRPSQVDIQHRC